MPTSVGPASAWPLLDEFETSLRAVAGEGTDQLFGPSFELLRQTARAYDEAKAIALAAIGCRAALENAAFSLLAYEWVNGHGRRQYWGTDERGRIRNDLPRGRKARAQALRLREMLQILESRGVLQGDLLEAAKRIKAHGDQVAHYSESQDRRTKRAVLAARDPVEIESVEPTAPEVLNDFRDTGRILLAFVLCDQARADSAKS